MKQLEKKKSKAKQKSKTAEQAGPLGIVLRWLGERQLEEKLCALVLQELLRCEGNFRGFPANVGNDMFKQFFEDCLDFQSEGKDDKFGYIVGFVGALGSVDV